MSDALELQNFFIDTVKPVVLDGEVDDAGATVSKVQMVRYSVLAPNAEEALRRYFEEEAGVVSEETEPTDIIVVGIFASDSPVGL